MLPQDRMARAANLQLARIKLATDDPADAIPFAEAAGTDATARLTLARALVGAGQNARARAELQRVEPGRGASAEAAVLLGWVELREGRRARRAPTPIARWPSRRAEATRSCSPPGAPSRRMTRPTRNSCSPVP